MAHADLVDTGLTLAGVLVTATAIGSALGITIAVLGRRPSREIELWGFWGTAMGCVGGVLLVILVAALT